MTRFAFKFRRSLAFAALVVLVGAGALVYAGHSYVASANPFHRENALRTLPAATGIDNTTTLMW